MNPLSEAGCWEGEGEPGTTHLQLPQDPGGEHVYPRQDVPGRATAKQAGRPLLPRAGWVRSASGISSWLREARPGSPGRPPGGGRVPPPSAPQGSPPSSRSSRGRHEGLCPRGSWAGQGWGFGSSPHGSSSCLPKILLRNQGLVKGMVHQAELYSLHATGGR